MADYDYILHSNQLREQVRRTAEVLAGSINNLVQNLGKHLQSGVENMVANKKPTVTLEMAEQGKGCLQRVCSTVNSVDTKDVMTKTAASIPKP